MLMQLVIASWMVVVIVIVHLVSLSVLVRLLRSHHQRVGRLRIAPLTLLFGASLGLFATHTVEIWLYAARYVILGAVTTFEQALYFSTVTYTTIGYGDVVLAHPWRILGAIEGATGIMMLGWSTAFLVSLLTQVRLLSHDWLAGGSAKSQPGH